MYDYKITYTATEKILLMSYYPVKCPYNNYTCYDLVKDYIYMYSWILTENTTLIDFLQLLINGDKSIYTHYATDIIQVLSNQNQIYNSLRRC